MFDLDGCVLRVPYPDFDPSVLLSTLSSDLMDHGLLLCVLWLSDRMPVFFVF